MKFHLYKFVSFLLIITFFIPLIVEGITIENPLKYDSFTDLLSKIVDFLFYLAVAIAPIMIIIAGFYFITATGDPQKIDIAKKIILWTLVGLLIITSAKGLIALFKQIFGINGETSILPNCYTYIKNMVKYY